MKPIHSKPRLIVNTSDPEDQIIKDPPAHNQSFVVIIKPGNVFPKNTAVRTGDESTHTHLTQPTGIGGELGWQRFYHKPVLCALGGIHQGLFDSVEPDR